MVLALGQMGVLISLEYLREVAFALGSGYQFLMFEPNFIAHVVRHSTCQAKRRTGNQGTKC